MVLRAKVEAPKRTVGGATAIDEAHGVAGAVGVHDNALASGPLASPCGIELLTDEGHTGIVATELDLSGLDLIAPEVVAANLAGVLAEAVASVQRHRSVDP